MKKFIRKIEAVWRFRRLRLPFVFDLQVRTVIFAFLLTVPLWAKGYLLFQFSSVCLYAIALVGLNIVMGFCGVVSVGHGAIFGLGAYAVAILAAKWSVPLYLSLPLAGLVCGCCGILIAVPALRLERHALVIPTFALAIAFPQVLLNFDDWTGGSMGLDVKTFVVPKYLESIGCSTDLWSYVVCLSALLIVFYCTNNLMHRRFGRAVKAIRDNDLSSPAVGVNVSLFRVYSFALSSFITGIAGGLFGLLFGHVAPEAFGLGLSISFLSALIVGGLSSMTGPIFGALFLEFIPNLSDTISKTLTSGIFGIAIIVFMYSDPLGAAGFIYKSRLHVKKWWSYVDF